jgi:hypothetical protein
MENLFFLETILFNFKVESRIYINSDIVLKEIDENVKKAILIENSKILEFKVSLIE